MYYCGEPERVAVRGESELILNVQDCGRAGDVCMRVVLSIANQKPGLVADERRRPRIGDRFREGCR